MELHFSSNTVREYNLEKRNQHFFNIGDIIPVIILSRVLLGPRV